MNPTKTKFSFKSKKEKDAEGNVVMIDETVKDEKTGAVTVTGKKVEKVIPAPPPVEYEIPLVDTVDDIMEMLKVDGEGKFVDEKQAKLLFEAANNIILEQARGQINDPEFDREKGLDYSQLTWAHIANLPPAQRRGPAIPEETWAAFEKDYVEVMQHHGKSEEKARAGAKLLLQKFQPVKLNKKVVGALKTNLQTWFTNSEKAEDFQEIYENLIGKADVLLEKDEDALVAAI